MKEFDKLRVVMKEINVLSARRFIKDNHYSKSMPSSLVCIGFYVDNQLNACIVYSQGANNNVSSIIEDEEFTNNNILELVRLYSHDWAGKNMESYCIAQSIKYLKEHYPEIQVLISYADPCQGHVGTVYQATNWKYTGLSGAVPIYRDRQGKMHHSRIMSDYRLKMSHLSRAEIANKLGWTLEEVSPKHRYMMFIGSNKQNKKNMKNLKYEFLEYPKQ
jgi:hypothetical protein